MSGQLHGLATNRSGVNTQTCLKTPEYEVAVQHVVFKCLQIECKPSREFSLPVVVQTTMGHPSHNGDRMVPVVLPRVRVACASDTLLDPKVVLNFSFPMFAASHSA